MTDNALIAALAAVTSQASKTRDAATDDCASAGELGREPSTGSVSEAAELIARLIPVLPEHARAYLGRLLQHRLTAFDHRQVRYMRLGLLIDLVASGTGEMPSTRCYETEPERRRRAQLGETGWPAHSTLTVAYGSWVRAVRAAMLLWRDGPTAKTPASNHHRSFERTYRHEEATAALIACASALGEWPTEWEYDEWRRVCRELARNSGRPAPRYPSRGVWRKLFGTWEAFSAAARRRAQADETGPR